MAAGWCAVNLVPFDYVILRAAPRIQRGEFVNVGAVLYCRALDFLGAAWDVEPSRLKALDPAVGCRCRFAHRSNTSARSAPAIRRRSCGGDADR